ncbi:GNAT family N-acetyltransferase [Streptomyces sp. DW26H14]|uniref:GNAT family N-acetyltransferase n=1 Tax=Streptomyces sp. DW26H14 TaxID=3435395 RepID=UPI00403E064B
MRRTKTGGSGRPGGRDGGALVEVVRGVAALPDGLWRQLAPPDDPMWTRDVFAAMEKGRIGPEGYAYLLLRRGGDVVAVLPLCLFRGLRLDDVVGPRERRTLAPVRRWAPWLLRVPMLFCGNLLGQGHLLCAEPLSGADARLLVRAVKGFARRERIGTIVFKDFTPDALDASGVSGALGAPNALGVPGAPESPDEPAPLGEALADAGFFTVRSLPDTELALGYGSFEEYVAALPAKPRRNARSKLRKSAATPGLRTETVADWGPLVPAMLDLYGQVMARADQTLDVLDADFLTALAESTTPTAGPRGGQERQESRLVACFQDDRMVAFLLCLFAGGGAVGARIGLDYGLAHEARLYHAVHYAAIRLALERGCRHIRFAQTAYVPKLELGCALVEQTYALTHLRPIRRALLRRLLPPALAGARADALAGAHEARPAPPREPAPGAARAPRDPRATRPGREDEDEDNACPE